MNTRTIFQLLKQLTSQTTTQSLVSKFVEILAQNYAEAQLVVFELQVSRNDGSKVNNLICLDCMRTYEPINLNLDEDLYHAFSIKSVVNRVDHERDLNTTILPVELYDKTISHLVRITHPYQDQSQADLLRGFVEIFSDIFRNLHEKGYDPLTRILNRQAFDNLISDLAYANNLPKASAKLEQQSFNTIAILDIDKFKAINDQYGHALGDETLVLFAQTIRSVLRQDDMFFRYGGEEFVVFVKEADQGHAMSILERCRKKIESRRFPQVGDVTISIGIANLSDDCHPLESLSKADKALYYAKHNGRNQVQKYERLLELNLLEAVEPIEGSVDFWDD